MTTVSRTGSYCTAKQGHVLGSVQNEDMWLNRNALHVNAEAVDRLFDMSHDLVVELVQEFGDLWKLGVKSAYAERQRRLKQEWVDPDDGPI